MVISSRPQTHALGWHSARMDRSMMLDQPKNRMELQSALESEGYALVSGVESRDNLLELGRCLGHPVPSPTGETVREIRVTPREKSVAGSQSSRHGAGSFPLHTDTVFWANPVRYVILRGRGDTRRPTLILTFNELFERCDKRIRDWALRSVWTVRAGPSSLFCSLQFGSDKWRYDPDLMRPVNESALRVDAELCPISSSGTGRSIRWSGSTALVLANWRVLHGRGPQPPNEGERIIERLYVR